MAAPDVISGFLHEGENILWIGKPGGSLAPSPNERASLVALLFVLTTLAVALSAAEKLDGDPVLLAAVGGFLGLAGLLQLQVLYRSFMRRRGIVYCLTNERALIVESSGQKSRAWLRIAYDTPVAVTRTGRGRGHVAFGRRYDFDTEERPIFRGFAFYGIREVERVTDLIERLQDGMAPPGTVPGIRAMARPAPVLDRLR
jgi:hypothetical protein